MRTHKKLKARILSLALSAAMVGTMMQTTVFATEGGNIAPGASSVGEIQSFDKLDSRFDPSTGKDAPSHVYGLAVEQDTPEEDLNLPDELTAMVARTTTVATPSDATEDVTEEIKNENVPLAPEPEQDEETTVTTVEQETIPVTWNSDKEYVSDEKGQFIYTAEISEDYILADGVKLPQIYVSVGRQTRTAGDDAAKIGDQGYATLQAAITAVTEGQTIVLQKNLTEFVAIAQSSAISFNLDLNGKTLTSADNLASTITHNGTGTLTIQGNGTVKATNGYSNVITNSGTGNVTVSGGTVSHTAGGNSINNKGAGNITVSGGTVSTPNGGAAIFTFGTGNVTVSGGTVSAPNAQCNAIASFGTGTVTVSGGKVSAAGNMSIAINIVNAGKLIISGAGMIETSGGAKAAVDSKKTGPVEVKDLTGDFIVKGDVLAMTKAPTLTGVACQASTSYDGTGLADYDAANIATYKYLKFTLPVMTIDTQPTSTTVTYGAITGNLTVAGTVNTDDPVTYQWYKNATNAATGGTPVSGATSGTFTIPTDLDAGTYYYYCVLKSIGCADKASNVATVTVNKADATTAMTTVAASVSKNGAAGATATIPALPAGASYGTIAYGGTITYSDASASGTTLTYTAPASTEGQTGTITLPVTGATNYNDYNLVVTVTSTDKKPATITADVADKTYNGEAVTQPTPTAVEENTATTVTLTYTYKWQEKDNTSNYVDISGNTAPKDAGDYKLIVEGTSDTHAGKKEITFTISKATITITADNKSAYVGDAKPALTYTATGKASGDTLVTEPTLAYESEPDMSKAGNVKITASGAAVPNEDNYESAITYVDGTLTIAKLPAPTPEKPTITAGGGSNHQISSGKDITFTCSGALEDLEGIYVDGKLVDPSNYTLKSGSTILTLKASYLDTLSVGKHTLKFQYKDNVSAETNFTITAKAGETPTTKPGSPQTGDSSNLMILFTLLLASGGTLTALLARRRKTGRHYSK